MKVILDAAWRGSGGVAGPSTTRWSPRVTSSPGDRGSVCGRVRRDPGLLSFLCLWPGRGL